jgi:dihydrofolate reductase
MPAYAGVKNYVLSRTLADGTRGGVEIISQDAVDFVQRLKRRRGKGICIMGGGELAAGLFEAELIDELGLNIHPVLLGTGIPLFPRLPRQVDLELLESRQFTSGCVYLLYRVLHRKPQ